MEFTIDELQKMKDKMEQVMEAGTEFADALEAADRSFKSDLAYDAKNAYTQLINIDDNLDVAIDNYDDDECDDCGECDDCLYPE